jgi:hypothetical protein
VVHRIKPEWLENFHIRVFDSRFREALAMGP